MNLTSIMLFAAIIAGALISYATPAFAHVLGDMGDYTLLTLVGCLFFGVSFQGLAQALRTPRVLAIAVGANFILIPWIGYAVASLFLSAHPLILVGLVIYFMSPCTDWFLSFTRLSGGNVALGTALIPINMSCQLLLYPFFLQWFMQHNVHMQSDVIGETLLQWFLLPLIAALVLRLVLEKAMARTHFDKLLGLADSATTWITALLVLQIFAGNTSTILEHLSVFLWVLLAVFVFFTLTFALGEGLARVFKLNYSDHVLLAMTMAARNAPLMLAVTVAVLPNQPLVYAALVIGMLLEFPHLTMLSRILLSKKQHSAIIATPTVKSLS